ncbi:MAG: hypothetical protein IPM79_36185 [Polyangiaceae bacterium]|nr:hypothetical protein [Polyangiaceae bacterium]
MLEADSLRGAIEHAGTFGLVVPACWMVHELIHQRAQTLGVKADAQRLRGTGIGGETNLLHADLGADHAAARIVALAFDRDLLEIKDAQGRSLVGFPAGRHHSVPGWFRKALRLTSLRADVVWRRLHGPELLADGYVFVDFGPAGGPIALFRSGPPFGVLHIDSLDGTSATRLHQSVSAEDPTPIEAVDDVLQSVVRRSLESGRSRAEGRR